jgi:hypothetical protein
MWNSRLYRKLHLKFLHLHSYGVVRTIYMSEIRFRLLTQRTIKNARICNEELLIITDILIKIIDNIVLSGSFLRVDH